MTVQDAIQTLARTSDEIYSVAGQVVSADSESCTVRPVDGPDLYGVRYTAEPSATAYVRIKPRTGSQVIVTFMNRHTGYIAMCDDPESVEVITRQTAIEINDDGVRVERAGQNLGALLGEMLDQIAQITVPTPAGPSSPPVNAAAFISIKTRLNKILK